MRLDGKDAEKFIQQDKEPLSEEEIKDLERCRELYKKNPILTVEDVKESPIYDSLSEEFKKDLPFVLECMRENKELLDRLQKL